MRKYLLPIALLFAGSAYAEPPASMTYMTQSPPLLACDTRLQIDEVIASIKEGKVKEKLAEMQDIKDEHNEAVCLYSPLSNIVFGQSEHIGQINDRDQTLDVWVVHLGNRNTDFYAIWADLVKTSSL